MDDLPFGMPVRHIPPNYGNFHLIYNNGDFTIDTYLNYNSKISFNNLAESERAKPYMYALDENGNPYSPSWMTFNIRSKYSISKMLNFNFTVENITNKLYRPYSSGISAPGLNFIFLSAMPISFTEGDKIIIEKFNLIVFIKRGALRK